MMITIRYKGLGTRGLGR